MQALQRGMEKPEFCDHRARKPTAPRSYQNQERVLPRGCGGSMVQSTPRFWTSGLQNCQRIQFWVLKTIFIETQFIYNVVLVSGVQQSEMQSSQVALVVKNPPANAGDARDMSSIPGLGRSPGGGHGNPLQYSCLENPMDRGAWWATIHRVAKSWIRMRQLSTHIYLYISLSVYIYCFLDSFPLQVSVILYIYTYFHYILF